MSRFGSRKFDAIEYAISEGVVSAADDLALAIEAISSSRERSLAMTKLEEAVMWANRAIRVERGANV